MEKRIVTLSLLGLSPGSFAQVGIAAGMNLANYSYAGTRFDADRHSLLAFNSGIQYKKELTGKLFLLPGPVIFLSI